MRCSSTTCVNATMTRTCLQNPMQTITGRPPRDRTGHASSAIRRSRDSRTRMLVVQQLDCLARGEPALAGCGYPVCGGGGDGDEMEVGHICQMELAASGKADSDLAPPVAPSTASTQQR